MQAAHVRKERDNQVLQRAQRHQVIQEEDRSFHKAKAAEMAEVRRTSLQHVRLLMEWTASPSLQAHHNQDSGSPLNQDTLCRGLLDFHST